MTKRERGILRPFIELAKGIPENWPSRCALDFRLDEFPHNRIYLSYFMRYVVGAPTIEEWRALVKLEEAE